MKVVEIVGVEAAVEVGAAVKIEPVEVGAEEGARA